MQRLAKSWYRKFGYLFSLPLKNSIDPNLLSSIEETKPNNCCQDLFERYCKSFSLEADHIISHTEKTWLYKNFEKLSLDIGDKESINIFECLAEIDLFDKFLHSKFQSTKRFSIMGLETSLLFLNSLIDCFDLYKIQECFIGMPHRGRTNLIPFIDKRAYKNILAEFKFEHDDIFLKNSGDVKFHVGGHMRLRSKRGNDIYLNLSSNPSHLESINTVVMGKTLARQNVNNKNSICFLLHGDAAFCGQGIVYESMCISKLKNYNCGGVIHIILNNNIGFTTNPIEYTSMTIQSDISKAFGIPVIHIDASDPVPTYILSKFVLDYRKKFSKDIIINYVGYRKYGHNEIDEPRYTHPLLYKKISKMISCKESHKFNLIKSGILSKKEIIKKENDLIDLFESHYNSAKISDSFFYASTKSIDICKNSTQRSSINIDMLGDIKKAIENFPDDFELDKKIQKLVYNRILMLEGKLNVDWSCAEFIFFASAIIEGVSIRMSGQDVVRGTFSNRHAHFFSINDNNSFCPIKSLETQGVRFDIFNSPLSEYGTLGFEYGYSSQSLKKTLCIWEAQFGDFANGAQIIIDQFIASGLAKWKERSNLCLLLPHGYEGQGPEHSSCRLERFLQMCANENMRVVNCSTPANFFHTMRNQLYSSIPLVLATPKSLLRKDSCSSKLQEFLGNKSFKIIMNDSGIDKDGVKKLIICSGKFVYDLYSYREENNIKGVSIISLEQLYPFPIEELYKELSEYQNLSMVVWCQEEPKNMGAWSYFFHKIYENNNVLSILNILQYIGRPKSSSSATGHYGAHLNEQKNLLISAFSL